MASMPNVVTLKIDGHVSEREAVSRERAAYLAGSCKSVPPCILCVDEAARRYPLPKASRPRVVGDPHFATIQWRIVDSRLEFCVSDDAWLVMLGERDAQLGRFGSALEPTGQRVAVWADLFANPTELVDDDGSAGGAS